MINYYLLIGKNSPQVASAFAPEEIKPAHELMHDLSGVNELPFELELVKLSIGKVGLIKSHDLTGLNEIWLDYLPNSLAWPFFSKDLKDIVNKYLTGKEGINWLTAKIDGNSQQKVYYIPRFEQKLDVLNPKKTMFVEDTDLVISPCFSLSKINNFSMFHIPSSDDLWKITPGIYVNEELKKAIQKEKLKGIDFEKTKVA